MGDSLGHQAMAYTSSLCAPSRISASIDQLEDSCKRLGLKNHYWPAVWRAGGRIPRHCISPPSDVPCILYAHHKARGWDTASDRPSQLKLESLELNDVEREFWP